MEHTIAIWSKKKKDGKCFLIETRIKIHQSQIEDMAVRQFKTYSLRNNDREYWGELEETVLTQ